MNTCTTTASVTTVPTAAPAVGIAAAVAAWMQRVDAWLARRARQAKDRATLAAMSERELHDIGLGRGFVDDVARGAWQRDGMR